MFGLLVQTACKDDPPEPPKPSGKLIFNFMHHINGADVDYDTLMYTNAAGNLYSVNEIQYFISDVTLYKSDGSKVMIEDWKDYAYVDIDIPSTLTWNVYDSIPVGDYDSISFTFGFNAEKNQSFMFVNPPERDMFWPEYLGGGYHYMKLNLKWMGPDGYALGNTFHLGIGQTYDTQGNITGFVQNFFNISLPNSSFSMADKKTMVVDLVMNVEEWFDNPNVYDFDYWGTNTMQNQDAMHTIAENGWNVFSVASIHQN